MKVQLPRSDELATSKETLGSGWFQFLKQVELAINGAPELPTYVKANLPDVAKGARTVIFVSDEAGGAGPAFSDGTHWRRFSDYAVVS